jgi:hypothetical protein
MVGRAPVTSNGLGVCARAALAPSAKAPLPIKNLRRDDVIDASRFLL